MSKRLEKPANAKIDMPSDSEGALEEAKRIMKRLTEMPHKPHEPIGKRPQSDARKSKPSRKPKTE
jgi:hypothetical protein